MAKVKRKSKPVGGGPTYPYFSKIIEKGLNILSCFTPETTSLSLKSIVSATGINPASTYRFVETLISLGYLKKDPRTKLVKLGPTALILSNNITKSFDILQIVKPYFDEAYEKFNVSIDAVVVEGKQLINFYRRSAKDTMIFNVPMQASDCLHCTAVGKAYLSALSEEEAAELLGDLPLNRRTSRTLTRRAAVFGDLRKAREKGFAVNNEEYIQGLISLGVPLLNRDGIVLGAVAFDVSTFNFSVKEAEARFAPALVGLAQIIRPMLPL
jgi:DNA-binding IclR family transcriptional regulator